MEGEQFRHREWSGGREALHMCSRDEVATQGIESESSFPSAGGPANTARSERGVFKRIWGCLWGD